MKRLATFLLFLAIFALPQFADANHPNGCHGTGVGCIPVPPELAGGPDPAPAPTPAASPRDTPSFDESLAGAPGRGAPLGPVIGGPDAANDPAFMTDSEIRAADLAAELECTSSNNESALEGALGRLSRRLGDAALDGVQSGLRGRGTAGRILSDILGGDRIGDVLQGAGQDLADGLGEYASGWITEQLGDSCGDSNLGRQICRRVGDVIGDYASDFISEQGGQLVGNILSEIGLGEAGGAFGNAIGGAVGSIVGGFLGGGDDGVPVVASGVVQAVNQRSREVHGVLNNIYQLTDVEINRVCVNNPLTAALETEAQAQAAARALEVGTEQLVDNPTETLQRVGREAQVAHCENLRDPQAQRRCAEWILAQEEGERINSCGSTNYADRLWNEEACRSIAREYDRFQRVRVEAQIAYMQSLDPDLATEPLGVCMDGPNAGSTERSECVPPYRWVTRLPGGDVTVTRQRAENLRFDIRGTQVGEAAGGLISDIIEEITTVVEDEVESGLKRLVSDRDSRSGRRGGASYVDRLGGRGGSAGPSVQDGRNLFVSNITNSIEMEAQFQELTAEVIDGFENASATFKELNACFIEHSEAPPPELTREAALAAAANASTTIQAILEPQLAFHRQEMMRSQGTVASLGVLLDQAQAAQGGDALNLVSQNYNAMRNAGVLFSTSELQFKAEELASLIVSLGELQKNADGQLSACTALLEI